MNASEVTLMYVSEVIKTLYLHKPYYGYTLSQIKRRITVDIPTCCVVPSKLELHVNPDFFAGFENEVQQLMLEHEVLHIAFRHWPRFQFVYEAENCTSTEQHVVNIAQDCAINQLIDFPKKLKEHTFVSLEMVEKMCEKKLEEKQTAEYYYRELMQSKAVKQNMKNEQDFIDAMAEALGKMTPDQVKKMLDGMKDAHGRCHKDAKAHEMPAKLKEVLKHAKRLQEQKDKKAGVGKGQSILDLLPEEVNQYDREIWKKLIDKNLGDDIVADVDCLFGRPSRRVDGSFWWKKHQTRSKTVYVGFDTSASVDDRAISRFLGYLSKGLRANCCACTLILCDYAIQDVRKVKSVRMGTEFKVAGRGGTDLRHILDYIEKNEKAPKNARLILFTDGETPWRASEVKTSVVYTPRHSALKEGIISSAVMEATMADEY